MTSIVQSRLDALVARCRREVDEGRLPGFQLAVGFEGEIAYAESYGTARDDQRFMLFSAVKPTVALTVLELVAEGILDPDAPVADVLPSFGGNGKADITLSQVMLHAGGFPLAELPESAADRDVRLEAYGEWTTITEPGSAYAYHSHQAHWVQADCIEEVTGRPYADVIEERIMAPAGARRWLAIPADDQHDIVEVFDVGAPTDPAVFKDLFGFDAPVTDVTNEGLRRFNRAEIRALGHPGGGGIASAGDVASWYQAILHDDGTILRPEVRAEALRTIRQNHPDWMGVPANRTRAFTVAGADGKAAGRGHGHTVSEWTFGHGGARGQIAWADPESGISLGFVTNGLELDDILSARRSIGISSKAGLLTTPE